MGRVNKSVLSVLLFGGSRERPPFSRFSRFYSTSTGSNADKSTGHKSSQDVMQLASNRAMRFVFLRTLPLAKTPELAENVDKIAAEIESAAARVCERHIDRATDDRAAVHLHMGALAIASHRVLWPRIKNDIAVENIIRAAFGAQLVGSDGKETKLPAYWISRFALMFSFNRMDAVRKMGANFAKDFGASFDVQAVDENNGDVHRLVIRKCFYHSLCKAEELPQLTPIFCSLDKALFAPVSPSVHGIQFSLAETLADERENDSKCNFVFTRVSGTSV